jgi:AbrB family looped-hinge helix DNA binding protein
MTTLTVTSKGQVTLKREVLQHIGIKPGDKVEIDLLPGGKAAIRAERPKKPIESIFGMLKREGEEPLSLEEIKQIAEEGWAGQR